MPRHLGGKYCSDKDGVNTAAHASVRKSLLEIETEANFKTQAGKDKPRPTNVLTKAQKKQLKSGVSLNCAKCGKNAAAQVGGHVKPCQSCLQVAYCSKECQKADWKNHKNFCNSQSQAAILREGSQHSEEKLRFNMLEWTQTHILEMVVLTQVIIVLLGLFFHIVVLISNILFVFQFAYMIQHALLPGLFGDSPDCVSLTVNVAESTNQTLVVDAISLRHLRADELSR